MSTSVTLLQTYLPQPQWQWPAQSPHVTHEAQIPHHHRRHHQQSHAPSVRGHSLSPVKSLPANTSCRPLNNLSSAELFSSLLSLPQQLWHCWCKCQTHTAPGSHGICPCISTPSWAATGLTGHPLGARAANEQHGMNPRQAVQSCAGSTTGSAGRALPPLCSTMFVLQTLC